MVHGIMLAMVTNNTNLYNTVIGKLNAGLKIVSSKMLLNAGMVESSLSNALFNVVIWDYDYCDFRPAYLTAITSKYNVLVILTARSGVASIPPGSSNAIKFITLPSREREFDTFANNIKSYIITAYMAKPSLNYLTSQKTIVESNKIIAIASSTGGTIAVETLLTNVPHDCPPILIVQHIITGFSSLFAERLNQTCKAEVREARSNDYLQRGLVLVAPADRHMVLTKRADKLAVNCFAGEKVNSVMPSADVLFESVAKIMHKNAIGVILTGMGSDGARGLLQLRNAGAKTIGQDEASCVVYGMPKVAYDIGAVQKQLPIDQICEEMLR
jgi:two-component system chemotaxis response regulator CheB